MEIKKANSNFSVEDLVTGKLAKQNFKIDYLPMWKFLDGWERKDPKAFKNMDMKTIFEGIYEYAVISVSLDKSDMTTRIDQLNEQNLRWFTRADSLEIENTKLKEQINELQSKINTGILRLGDDETESSKS